MRSENFHHPVGRASLEKLLAIGNAQLLLSSAVLVDSWFQHRETAHDWGKSSEVCSLDESLVIKKFFLFSHLVSLLQIISNQSRSCTAWNISLHEYSPVEDEKMHAGPILHQFCPRDKHKQFTLPWNVKTIVIKIQAMTRTAPLYTVRWKSQVVRQKVQSLTPAPNVVAASHKGSLSLSLVPLVLLLFYFKVQHQFYRVF